MDTYKFRCYWKRIFSILFCTKKKVYIIAHPTHPNLGDQAQLMCTEKWLKENWPDRRVIRLGITCATLNFGSPLGQIRAGLSTVITVLAMKLRHRKDDLFIGHSGYFFIDHHTGYKAFMDMMHYFPENKMLILPQTVNFYTPVVKRHVSREFAKSHKVTLLCRDEVSYGYAKELFPTTPSFLYPDIVTTLIGTRHYGKKREGVLFCMRDDIEALYKPSDIDALMARYGNTRTEKIDTTLKGVTTKDMDAHREQYINGMIEKIASYQAVITDRYHGTIFSAIASTPVIVISSADHKLSSGVKWFPQEQFSGYIYYAKTLDEAYALSRQVLARKEHRDNPPYFKEEYWDKLVARIEAN